MNIGHGHVIPRDDGVLARCGGPALCKECKALQDAMEMGVVKELRTYAEHRAYCETGYGPGRKCTCGLDALLKATANA